MKNKAFKITIITAIGSLAIVGAITIYTYQSMSKESVSIQETVSVNDEGKTIEIKETHAEPVEDEFPSDITEYAVQNAIHGMSHQKTRAEDKWGFIPLTAERVNRLKAVVEANEYEEKGLYLDILNRWANNDFSRVDHDHNAIWDLQGGTIGKATGILSVEEEKAFIEEHYDIE
ncbi:DUF6241 domain-containing protein [Cytobacillus gottheilii]|uniref:DUF6241 domain-containing protein n=1 Tax=Cytobacillus gottheilii TaxID=859144 RepID=UPI0009BA4008|nr:DUF6241 domain-containing protein [Cytobacillus gottheilii]